MISCAQEAESSNTYQLRLSDPLLLPCGPLLWHRAPLPPPTRSAQSRSCVEATSREGFLKNCEGDLALAMSFKSHEGLHKRLTCLLCPVTFSLTVFATSLILVAIVLSTFCGALVLVSNVFTCLLRYMNVVKSRESNSALDLCANWTPPLADSAWAAEGSQAAISKCTARVDFRQLLRFKRDLTRPSWIALSASKYC